MKMARRRPPAPYIPFISLADIAWQIIIFFLLAATFAKNDSLNLEIPGASSDKTKSAAPTITVQAGENAILVNGDRIAPEQLEGRIKQLLAGKKSEAERAVIVLAKNDLPFQQHVDVMYAVQRAGGILVMSEEQ
jgi:biopolymer transport protein ExbD